MPTLYVLEPGSRLEKEYQRLLVTKHDEVLFRAPIQRVTQVVLVGYVSATSSALLALLDADIPLFFINRNGKLRGRLLPPSSPNLPLRQRQYQADQDAEFALKLAKSIVKGKIKNQLTLARRICRRQFADQWQKELNQIETSIYQIDGAEELSTLLGIEGHTARIYFRVYRSSFAPEWRFNKRTRRPPKDPVNSLLSLGYSMLTQTSMTALEAVGLDPYLGFFHVEKYGRPALALDLVEEFRAPIVDSLTLTLCNRQQLKPTDFHLDSKTGGTQLKPAKLRLYFKQFSQRLDSKIQSRELGRKISYRKLMEVQARKLARLIKGDEIRYKPFRAR